jgi:poly(3-hydroxyalkanoate) synthetase
VVRKCCCSCAGGDESGSELCDRHHDAVRPRHVSNVRRRKVDLKSIKAPVLNVFALDDHIIPPDCSRALGCKIGSDDYTEIPLPGGHVGLFVSSKSQGKLSQSIADWLVARE